MALGLALGILAGCTYRGEIDQPATLKATWFSYLNGDDIRSACADGTPVRYRLVARFQNFRRLCIRWEKSTALF